MTDAPTAPDETSAEAAPSPQPVSDPPAAPSAAASSPGPDGSPAANLDLLSAVEIEVTVELGRRRMSLGEVSRLNVGSVVELDTLAGEPLVLYANGRRIATGEAVVVEGKFGIRIQSLGAG